MMKDKLDSHDNFEEFVGGFQMDVCCWNDRLLGSFSGSLDSFAVHDLSGSGWGCAA